LLQDSVKPASFYNTPVFSLNKHPSKFFKDLLSSCQEAVHSEGQVQYLPPSVEKALPSSKVMLNIRSCFTLSLEIGILWRKKNKEKQLELIYNNLFTYIAQINKNLIKCALQL